MTSTTTRRLPDAQLTHVGIYVRDLDAMVAFYCDNLGLLLNDIGAIGERRLAFLSRSEHEHHQLVLAHDPARRLGSESSLNQVSFRVRDLEDLRSFYADQLARGAEGLEGRNHGNSWSFYFFDPEGNKVEMYAVTPWQVQQPWRVPLDLTRSVAEIEAETLAIVATLPTARPLVEWQQQMRQRLVQA